MKLRSSILTASTAALLGLGAVACAGEPGVEETPGATEATPGATEETAGATEEMTPGATEQETTGSPTEEGTATPGATESPTS